MGDEQSGCRRPRHPDQHGRHTPEPHHDAAPPAPPTARRDVASHIGSAPQGPPGSRPRASARRPASPLEVGASPPSVQGSRLPASPLGHGPAPIAGAAPAPPATRLDTAHGRVSLIAAITGVSLRAMPGGYPPIHPLCKHAPGRPPPARQSATKPPSTNSVCPVT
jgi:hypothetical protein